MSKKEKQVAPVLLKTRDGTGVLRGRDVREKLGGKIDPEVVEMIAKIAEINHVNMKAIAELATAQDQIINIVQKFADIAGNMKERTEQMARAMSGEAIEGDDNDVTHSQH